MYFHYKKFLYIIKDCWDNKNTDKSKDKNKDKSKNKDKKKLKIIEVNLNNLKNLSHL